MVLHLKSSQIQRPLYGLKKWQKGSWNRCELRNRRRVYLELVEGAGGTVLEGEAKVLNLHPVQSQAIQLGSNKTNCQQNVLKDIS